VPEAFVSVAQRDLTLVGESQLLSG